VVAIALQVLACIYFVGDALLDQEDPGASGVASIFEILIALALLAGIVLGAAYIMHLRKEARIREASVAVARGALARILTERFVEWGLSAAEADVAMFALKGCTVAQIADMRSAAQGTVRAQLSQVYAKAGVSSQPMLMSLFLEDLMSDQGLPPQP
jgi:DNA-binding CsgD family transcriptional regulator